MCPLSAGVGAKAGVFALAFEFRAACRTERSPRRPALRPQLAASGTRPVEFNLVSLVILGPAWGAIPVGCRVSAFLAGKRHGFLAGSIWTRQRFVTRFW